MTEKHTPRGSLLALTPLLVFLATYLAASLITGDFYRMPISVSSLPGPSPSRPAAWAPWMPR